MLEPVLPLFDEAALAEGAAELSSGAESDAASSDGEFDGVESVLLRFGRCMLDGAGSNSTHKTQSMEGNTEPERWFLHSHVRSQSEILL